MMKDYYKILGVAKTADEKEIKKAFRKLALEHHPDRNPNNKEQAEKKFKEVTEAYETLSNPQKRRIYDAGGQQGGFNPFAGRRPRQHGHDFNSIFNDLFRDFSNDPFSNYRSHVRGRQGPVSRKGQDIHSEIQVSLKDVLHGTTAEVLASKQLICPECNGSRASKEKDSVGECNKCNGKGSFVIDNGMMQIKTTCPQCGGTGKMITKKCGECNAAGIVTEKEEIKMKVPPGISSGNVLRAKGKGHAGVNGGPSGDLLVFVKVQRNSNFTRNENNLYSTVDVPVFTSILGGKIKIKTLEGEKEIEIEDGIINNPTKTLPGEGLPDIKTGIRGNLIVEFSPVLPNKKSLSQEQIDKLKETKAILEKPDE